MGSKTHRYWDEVAETWATERPQRLWREFCDLLNEQLISRNLPTSPIGRTLKTDLFDEATGERGLVSALSETAGQVVGIDLSQATARIASSRHIPLGVCTGDVCALPFESEAFDFVLSNSTLDHMDSVADIALALAEIRRVLRPGGRLLLTLDNFYNPIIALRSILPSRLLTGLRLVPYYVGATCGPKRLRSLVEGAGLKPLRVGAMMHCPRLPAVALCNLLDRFGGTSRKTFAQSLFWWETLERLPTRYITGYFITVVAVRS